MYITFCALARSAGTFFTKFNVQGSTLLSPARATRRVLSAPSDLSDLSDLSESDKTTFALVAAAK